MKLLTALPILISLHGNVMGVGENPQRTWTNGAGKSFVGTYQHGDGIKVWIKTAIGSVVAVDMADLSPGDRAAVQALQSDFGWKLKTAYWPGSISAPATRPAFRVSAECKHGMYVFRTRSFEFKVDKDLSLQAVGEFGRIFEASSELFAHLPWAVRPAPPDGTRYQARLFSERRDFMEATGAKDLGSAKIAALYKPGDRVIYSPLESLRLDNQSSNETLRHELTHQMMHDMLPVLPWWVAEGTAEYVRVIPWDGRGAYACGSVATKSVMKKLAAEGSMNEQAFTELFKDEGPLTPEAEFASQCETACQRARSALLKVRVERADWLAGRRKPAPQPENRPPSKVKDWIPNGIGVVDEGLVTVLKYHAAKMLVYYLQHLEGDGKGTRMLQLMWHLRQWADEASVHQSRFKVQAQQFQAAFRKFEDRAKDFAKMETAYQAALRNGVSSNGSPTERPKPMAPEEALINALPIPPDASFFTATNRRARWTDIKHKSIGDSPEQYYAQIIAAFHARQIELHVLEGDPRSPVRVNVPSPSPPPTKK